MNIEHVCDIYDSLYGVLNIHFLKQQWSIDVHL